jgi:integrase
VSVTDRWHLSRPADGAATCGKHKGKVASAGHGTGLRWQVRGLDDRGRPVKRSFEYEQQAKDFDAELKASVRSGRYVDERAGKVTLRSRCELWMTTRDHDPVTAERVEGGFRNHVWEDEERPGRTPAGGLAIGEFPMALLARQPSRLEAWLAQLPLAVSSKLLLFDILSAVFRQAARDHIIAENPFGPGGIERPRAVRKDVTAWEPETLAAVAGALPAHLEALPLLAGACGHRQGEAFAVAKSDIDFLRAAVRIEVQLKLIAGRHVFAPIKNDNARTVPVAAWVVSQLAEHMRLFPPVPVTLPVLREDHTLGKPVTRWLVFARPDGLALSRNSFNPMWRRAGRAAGVAPAGFHVCRHSAAAAWLSGGLNIARVAAYLGDTVQVVSTTYSHFLPSDEARARAIMDEHFGRLAERPDALRVPGEVRI